MKTKNVVIIGGGTGIYPVVSAARLLNASCSCIINCSDSGGSTGRIRDEFGFPPVGDLRQSLAALADPVSQAEIRELLLYRFSKGTSFKGHNLGNVILTALQDMTGSTTKALQMAQKVFRIDGQVIPVSEEAYTLHITYSDGSVLVGEDKLDDPSSPHLEICNLSLQPTPTLNPNVLSVLSVADHILIGPGDFYASLQSVLMVPGMSEAIQQSPAQITYFLNIMTRATQTRYMTASQHVLAIENSLGRSIDSIVINNGIIKSSIKARYAAEDEHPVVNDLQHDSRVRRYPLVSESTTQHSADAVPRTLLRHSTRVMKKVLSDIFS